jgi:hypothetical protein
MFKLRWAVRTYRRGGALVLEEKTTLGLAKEPPEDITLTSGFINKIYQRW